MLSSHRNWLFGTDGVFSNKGRSESREMHKWEGRTDKSSFTGARFNIHKSFSFKILKKKLNTHPWCLEPTVGS
jgi:hypothetical protein